MFRRHYRDRNDETPSYTGGVSDAYLKMSKNRKDKERGVYVSSKEDRNKNQKGLG